jgi:hypothetical protein
VLFIFLRNSNGLSLVIRELTLVVQEHADAKRQFSEIHLQLSMKGLCSFYLRRSVWLPSLSSNENLTSWRAHPRKVPMHSCYVFSRTDLNSTPPVMEKANSTLHLFRSFILTAIIHFSFCNFDCMSERGVASYCFVIIGKSKEYPLPHLSHYKRSAPQLQVHACPRTHGLENLN